MNNYCEGYWDGLLKHKNDMKETKPTVYFWDVDDEVSVRGATERGVRSFDELNFMYREELDGFQSWVKLRNGYVVSIVRHGGSYGHDKRGLFEIGVFHADSEGRVQMVTPDGWDDEVKGWLPPIMVLEEISKLEKQETTEKLEAENKQLEEKISELEKENEN